MLAPTQMGIAHHNLFVQSPPIQFSAAAIKDQAIWAAFLSGLLAEEMIDTLGVGPAARSGIKQSGSFGHRRSQKKAKFSSSLSGVLLGDLRAPRAVSKRRCGAICRPMGVRSSNLNHLGLSGTSSLTMPGIF